jgi:gentisate 1,2-dioxygenase
MMAQAGVVNGWHKDEPSLWPLPKKEFRPAHWSYAQTSAVLDAAGAVVSTELAERRNVILANPIPGNRYPTVKTLVSAYQMVRPGETARSHRHSANALRLVLDAQPGMFTIVEGRRIPMLPGDVLLTPNWHWHGHSNESSANGYWLDFLDVPLVHLLGPMFFEHHPDGIERNAPVDAASPMRFSWNSIRERLAAAPETVPGRREIELESSALPSMSLKVLRLAPRSSFGQAPVTANTILRHGRRRRLRRRRARVRVRARRRDRRARRLQDDLPRHRGDLPSARQRRAAFAGPRLASRHSNMSA